MKKIILALFTILFIFFIGYFVGKETLKTEPQETELKTDTIHSRDTIIVVDTFSIVKLQYQIKEVVRIDTVAKIDTFFVTVPIERKTYQDEQYKAVIEGYKPNLISLDIYNKYTYIYDSVFVNNTITKYKRPKWVISGGVGLGYTPRGIEPYIGVNIGYVFLSK